MFLIISLKLQAGAQDCIALQGQEDGVFFFFFTNVCMMLYIMYFPVYRSKEDYNNLTSAHSWLVLTLGVLEHLVNKLRNSSHFFVSLSADGDSLANKTKLTCNYETFTAHSMQHSTFSKDSCGS